MADSSHRLSDNSEVFYHFTSTRHIGRILGAKELRTTESNVSLKRTGAGPQVVWLTTEDTADLGLGLAGSSVDKSAIRFTVKLPPRQAAAWREWARAHGSTLKTIDILSETGGGADTWRVVERSISASEWIEVRNMYSGELIEWTN